MFAETKPGTRRRTSVVARTSTSINSSARAGSTTYVLMTVTWPALGSRVVRFARAMRFGSWVVMALLVGEVVFILGMQPRAAGPTPLARPLQVFVEVDTRKLYCSCHECFVVRSEPCACAPPLAGGGECHSRRAQARHHARRGEQRAGPA